MSGVVIPDQASASIPHVARPVDERILRTQAESLIHTIWPAVPSAIAIAAGLWAVFYYLTGEPAALVWAALIHPLQISRLLFDLHYARTPTEKRDPVRSANRQCVLLALSGVVWGLAPWMFLPVHNLPLTSVMTVVLVGMSSGGIASWAPFRRAIFCFPVPTLLGLAGALLWQGGNVNLFLAVSALVYLYVSIRFGVQQNRLITDALRTRYEKEELAERLAEQIRISERANLEKTRFLASASHDLRQPLHSVALFGATLLAKLKSTPDEPIARSLMTCVEALEASFTSMLDVSKLDAGVIRPKAQPVALAHLCQRLETAFGGLAEAHGLALRFRPGDHWVWGDPVLLERLLGNLVHNALKYTQHGGVVLVARKRKPGLSVEVWDNGSGIGAADLPHIFDEFYQVGNEERDRAKGLGMGLAIAKRLAALMNMPLTVHSRVGRGTAFKLLMPPARSRQEPSAEPRDNGGPEMHNLIGKRVLVIDDEENVRNSTAGILRQHGMNVETADGETRALELAQRPGQHPDLVITDLRLRGGINGIDVVNRLNERLGRRLPTLLITGDIAPDRVHLAQQSGLRVLYKPVKIDELLEALDELLA